MRPKRKQIPCVFKGDFIREQVDPRVKRAYAPKVPPWGDFRRTFKAQYCRRVNPTGYPEDCPFPEEDCAMKFLQVALIAKDADRPGAMFRRVAAIKGAEDADNRPLARSRVPEGRRVNLVMERREDPSRPVVPAVPEPEAEAPAVPGRTARPSSLAEVLRSMDPRAREVQPADGEEGMGP